MKNLFFVTSAIHTKHGIYSAAERLNQTVATVQSIQKYAPNSDIVIIESSAESAITEEESKVLLDTYPLSILDFSADKDVQNIYVKGGNNWDIVKNLTEMFVFAKVLGNSDFYSKFNSSRMFKISGRYTLNDNFHIENMNKPESYLFAKSQSSQFPSSYTGGLEIQFPSRLWSWPSDKANLVYMRYNLMLEDFQASIAKGYYRDIEHLLYRYFNGPCVTQFLPIGVEGNIGPNGNRVAE